MKKIFLLLLILCSSVIAQSLHAPSIIKTEYFYDSDPGFGKGLPLAVTSPDSMATVNGVCDVSKLSVGLHTLYIRVMDENKKWSDVIYRSIYKVSVPSKPGAVANSPRIMKCEYFYDTDPGFGKGLPLVVTSPDSMAQISGICDVTSLSVGLHTLYIRVLDENNRWSNVIYRSIYKVSVPASPGPYVHSSKIKKTEYFYDKDPGFGKGLPLQVVTSDTLTTVDGVCDVTSLTNGLHTLYIRVMDDNNRWSNAIYRSIYKVPVPQQYVYSPTPKVLRLEYFFDTDPGAGKGTGVSITADTLINKSFNADVTGLSAGSHTLFVRAMDENNKWGQAAYQKNITVENVSLKLASPNGGEVWKVGETHEITWTSSNISSVKIEYTVNNGTSWSEIVSSTTASTGSYSWKVPGTVSTQCKVRVSDAANSSVNDESDASFSIAALPAIAVSEPSSGLVWTAGSRQAVKWTSSSLSGSVNIKLSTDGGTTYAVTLASNISNTGLDSITVPNNLSQTCRIKVESSADATVFGVNPGSFTIKAAASIAIVSPHGGENWLSGESHSISWTSSGISNVKLEYSVNNGVDWNVITASTAASSGSYSWTVPNTPGTQSKVRVSDASNALLNSLSGAFTISVPAPVCSTLAATEIAATSARLNASVNAKNSSTTVSFEYGLTSSYGSTLETTQGALSGSAVVNVSAVLTGLSPNTLYHFRVKAVSAGGTVYGEDMTFTSLPQPVVAIVSPNGGESWKAGETHEITWTSSNVASVKIEYTSNNGTSWTVIASPVTASLGHYSWTVPNIESTQCKVRVSDAGNPAVNSVSSVFSINLLPSITVTAPASGATWTVGELVKVHWTSTSISGNVNIKLSTDGGATYPVTLATNVENLGLVNITVPNNISQSCRIKIVSISDSTIYGVNPGNFTIAEVISIALTSPQGGENWKAGETRNITWTTTGISNVKLEYSVNNGVDWNEITASTAASAGSYSWKVPGSVSTECKVRVSDAGNAAVNSVSDVFTISIPPTITVTAPASGVILMIGHREAVNWTSTNLSGNVNIKLSTDGGATYPVTLATNISNTGLDSITVPNNISFNCRIKVESASDNTIYGVNPGDFTIAEAIRIGLDSPRGGENWISGQVHNITWHSSGLSAIRIDFSSDNGASWSSISNSVTGSLGSYSWTVPNTPGTQCKVKVSDAGNPVAGVSAQSSVFTISVPAPVCSTLAATEVAVTSARLNASVNANNSSTTVSFEYGLTASYGSTLETTQGALSGSADSSVSAVLTGLTPNTLYHFRVKAVSAGGTVYGEDMTFNSLPEPVVALVSPKGGEVWKVGETHEITWTSSNVESVKIEFSSNNGADWTMLSASTAASSGSYSWKVPNAASAECKVRVSDAGNPAVNSMSSAFTISIPPTITVTEPGSDVILIIGKMTAVKWSSTNLSGNVNVKLSTDGGSTYPVTLASNISNSGLDSITVPNNISFSCRIKVESVSDTTVYGVTAGDFTIAEAIMIGLDSPRGGEKWITGETHNITWVSKGIKAIKIEFSSDNGANWTVISNSVTASLGSYSWTVPNTPGTQCKVKITDAVNPAGGLSTQSSVFTISVPAPVCSTLAATEVAVTSAKLNASVNAKNSSTTVSFEYGTTTSYGSTLETTQGALSGSAVSSVNAVLTGLKPNTLYHFRVKAVSAGGTVYGEDMTFTSLPAPVIALVSPKGGEVWKVGETHEVTWTSSNISSVKIEYSSNNGADWNVITASTAASSGSYSWKVPGSVSTEYKVRVSDTGNAVVNSVSNVFTISIPPTITVTAPASDVILVIGERSAVKWNSTNLSGNVNIKLSTDGGVTYPVALASNISNTGLDSIKVPNNISFNCRIKVESVSDSTVYGVNPGDFTIAETIMLGLDSPRGGEKWITGETHNITWVSKGIKALRIDFSSDNGASWSSISNSVTGSLGSYSWTVPNTPGTQCKVKITDAINPSGGLSVQSSVFTISVPAPVCSTLAATEVAVTSARLNASVNANNSSTTVSFEYGTTTSYGGTLETTQGNISGSAVINVSAVLTALSPNTLYHFRVKAVSAGGTVYGEDMTFTSLPQPVVALVSPKGGENWKVGETHEITWTSSNVESVKIEYTANNGVDWILIGRTDTVSFGDYRWTVPNTASTQCKIRVSDEDDPLVYSVSNAFTISIPPSIAVTAPGTGETWTAGQRASVRWTCTNLSGNVNIKLSLDGGTSYPVTLASNISNTGGDSITVPASISQTCRIKVESAGDASVFGVNPGNFSINFPVQISIKNNIAFGKVDDVTNFRIVGLPGNNNIPIRDLLEGKQKYDWNAFLDNGEDENYQIAYDGTDKFNFKPGVAFWVLSRNSINISRTVENVTLDANNSYRIQLHKGWNLISNPFLQNISWSDVKTSNNLANNQVIYKWDGKWDAPGVFESYTGYYYYNYDGRAYLSIPYNPVLGKLNKLSGSNCLKVSLEQKGEEKSNVMIGIKENSSLDFDQDDYPSPPSDFEKVKISLFNEKLPSGCRDLKIENRPSVGQGQAYDLKVKNDTEEPVELSLDNSGAIGDYDIYLMDKTLYKFTNLRESQTVSLKANSRREYTLFIGNNEYIETQKKLVKCTGFELFQNYPNPFNPSTVIRYMLAGTGKVKVTIYNSLGKEVCQLVNSIQEEGYHETEWKAEGMSSGIYFCSIIVTDSNSGKAFTSAKKMLLIK